MGMQDDMNGRISYRRKDTLSLGAGNDDTKTTLVNERRDSPPYIWRYNIPMMKWSKRKIYKIISFPFSDLFVVRTIQYVW